MRKYLFIALGSLLLMTGWGTASATPLIQVGLNGVQGFLSINNFNPGVIITSDCGGQLCMTMSNLSGSGGALPTTFTVNGQASPGKLDLFDPALDLKFNPSPGTTTDIRKLQMSWNDATATLVPNDPLNLAFGPGVPSNANDGARGETITINYSGGYSLMNIAFPGAGSLVLTVVNPTTNSDTITFQMVDNSTSGVSFTQALNFFDANTSKIGIIDGPFFVPEPASLALLGIGLAGLGVTRRQKKAA